MRVMVIVKADRASEAGEPPPPEALAKMQAFNDQLTKAGVLVGMGGLLPSSQGKRAKFTRGKLTVLDGPFTETKELIAGYAIWQVASMDEAFEWLARFPDLGTEDEVELRPMYEQGPCGTAYGDEHKAAAAE
jgi:hypothetical protein